MSHIINRAVSRFVEIIRSLYYAVLIKFIRADNSVEGPVGFVFKGFDGFIKPLQSEYEIAELMKLIHDRKPQTVLEIGTAAGGTLFLLAKFASKDAVILSIDLPKGTFGGGYPVWKMPLYRSFAIPRQKLHLIRADSHDDRTVRKVSDILRNRQIDLLFIDGDHTYEGVKKDYESYLPFVRRGGMIAFHDIVIHPPETGCDVHSFWEEVKGSCKHQEIIADRMQKAFGIGVLYVD